MNERDKSSNTPARREAIDINDFVYGATGSRIRRLTMPDGRHWFPAVDVCSRLGYTTTRKALLDHVPKSHRDFLESVTGGHSLSVPAGREWRRDLQVIDLKGLILLVNGCTKVSCGPFKEWVTEVILTVQREGSYTFPEARTESANLAATAAVAEPGTPVSYALPEQVADAIVRLEERNVRLDEEFAAVQRESLALRRESLATQREALSAHQATARAMERIADRLDAVLTERSDGSGGSGGRGGTDRQAPTPAPALVAQPPRPTAEAVLADWKTRMSVTEDVWAVAVTIAPALAEDGELRQPLESIASRTGLSVRRVNECLRFMRKHACIDARGGAPDGSPVYVLRTPPH
ncbi:Bro-N domain-containing protein [Streptomyces scopuliridis]|uniref:BRO-N domain-containing protein n=1 Tax=Streptomyces scopuliridis TaxID=452529 RepID=UPI0036CC93F3